MACAETKAALLLRQRLFALCSAATSAARVDRRGSEKQPGSGQGRLVNQEQVIHMSGTATLSSEQEEGHLQYPGGRPSSVL